ncbi:MAG TPA: SRPBCC domain-containing protein [Rhizomicrobium sp.]|jgi:uncharacterized protein YndB with AHSA1/START domain
MSNAGLARFIDKWTIEFVRTYPHPIERVWKAISDPAEVAIWFIRPTVWELRSGGAYRFEDKFLGPIELVEPPRRIRFRYAPLAGPWPGADAYFEFELESAAGGTRLRFVQHATPDVTDPDEPNELFRAPGRPGSLGGWHAAFDELGEHLDGVPTGSRLPPTRMSAVAENWAGFASEFTAQQKARILKGLRERERWFELVDIYKAHVTATRP